MKKTLFVLATVVLLSGPAFAAITGSAHDFSAAGWGTTEICLPCHTPHNSDTSVATAPLWNHEVTAVVAYTLYTSPTFDATAGQPAGASKLCLSCHDNTVEVDAFGGAGGSTLINSLDPNDNLGTTLANDHPVSFTYDGTLVTNDGGGLNNPATTASGVGTSLGHIDDDMLFSNQMECASCHDVHNQFNQTSLLLKSNAASALCLTCHAK